MLKPIQLFNRTHEKDTTIIIDTFLYENRVLTKKNEALNEELDE